MTIPSTTRRAGPFYGPLASGAQIPFAFKVFAATDIAVTIADADGVESVGVLNSDYLVTLNADQTTSPGGYVQYAVGGVATALPTGYTVAIDGAREYSQDTQLTQGSSFNPVSVERAFDVLTILVQQLKDAYDRTAKITVLSPSGTDTTLPIPEASSVIGWNEDGTALRNYPPDTTFSAALLESQLASTSNPVQGAAKIGDTKGYTGVQGRTQAKINDDWVSINDFLPSGFNTANDATTYVQAALDSGAKVVDFLGLALKHDAVTVPANVWAKNVNATKFTNAAGNLFQVNSGCTITGKITGTGITSAVQRGVYPAAAGVNDVMLNLEVSSFPYGVHPAPVGAISSANNPKRWNGFLYIHDISGTTGASEGYGLLLETAESCNFVVRGKSIKRHLVYLSAGASYNTVDADCDGCGNYAMQFNSLSASQPACKQNRVKISARNLTTDVAGQSGALAIVSNCHGNVCEVYCTGNATTYEAVRVEGGQVGVQADHPKGNKIIAALIEGQFTGGDVIRLLNADSTVVEVVSINAYATASVIASRRAGTNLSTHGGYFYGGRIDCQGQAIKGIYNEVNTVFSYRGAIDIRNNSTALRVDDQTSGRFQGYTRRVEFNGTTASIAATTSGDTTVTLADSVQTGNRCAAVFLTGSSVQFFDKPFWVGVNGAPSETQLTFRAYNGHSAGQTFNYKGWVEGD